LINVVTVEEAIEKYFETPLVTTGVEVDANDSGLFTILTNNVDPVEAAVMA